MLWLAEILGVQGLFLFSNIFRASSVPWSCQQVGVNPVVKRMEKKLSSRKTNYLSPRRKDPHEVYSFKSSGLLLVNFQVLILHGKAYGKSFNMTSYDEKIALPRNSIWLIGHRCASLSKKGVLVSDP